ncbi:MAG: hypothetical protein U1E63_10720 [Burkholderiales bacterium]
MGFEREPVGPRALSIALLDRRIRFESAFSSIFQILASSFGAVVAPDAIARSDVLTYEVRVASDSRSFVLYCQGEHLLDAATPDDLLFGIEKSLTVELQKRRPDLYFLHAAAVERKGKAFVLAADSGKGKSTTTWALLHHGFRYLSDELSAIDLQSMRVFPYPHALCLKQRPPAYPLPPSTIDLGRTLHVPVDSLPGEVVTEPLPLGGLFLVRYRPDLKTPELHSVSPAEAGARLYLTALNALSHSSRGLDAAIEIAARVPCYAIHSADLPATCALIRSALPA